MSRLQTQEERTRLLSIGTRSRNSLMDPGKQVEPKHLYIYAHEVSINFENKQGGYEIHHVKQPSGVELLTQMEVPLNGSTKFDIADFHSHKN